MRRSVYVWLAVAFLGTSLARGEAPEHEEPAIKVAFARNLARDLTEPTYDDDLPVLRPKPANKPVDPEPVTVEETCEVVEDPRFWVSGEYLLWWIKDNSLPPLVVTGSMTAVPGADPTAPLTLVGVPALGQPGTTVLFGGSPVDMGARSGGRFSAGYWLNKEETLGLEGSYFFLGSRSVRFAASSDGSPNAVVLARPVVVPDNDDFLVVAIDPDDDDHHHGHHHDRDDERVMLISTRGSTTTMAGATVVSAYPGSIQIALSSQLQGAEASLTASLARGATFRADLLAGFRFLDLDEHLDITQHSAADITATALPGGKGPVQAMTFDLDVYRLERFGTEDQFYGGQVGVRLEGTRDRFFGSFLGKLGVGDMHETVRIDGSSLAAVNMTVVDSGGATHNTVVPPTPVPGVLVQPTNTGLYHRDCVAVVPEATVRVGYLLTDQLRASVGYSFLYVSDVVRPGDQIDREQGNGHPSFLFHGTDFWAQGLDCQLEFRF